jgi:predicted alpha-1,2-mannosidase
MNNRLHLLTCLAVALGWASTTALHGASPKPATWVDPTLGTSHCRWFFFTPGAVPFGMAKPGPCTDAHQGNKSGWEAVGYDSRHDSIESFVSFREFQIGGIAVMATTGPLQTIPGRLEAPDEGYRSRIDHAQEVARPGYYRVPLEDYGILAELTATPRVAFHRFTYPAGQPGHLLFEVGHTQGESGPVLDAAVRRVADLEIEGFVVTHPRYINTYQPGAAMKMYFVARLDRTAASIGTYRGATIHAGQTSLLGPGAGLYLTFPAAATPTPVTLKLGQSYTSLENARLNLEREADQLDFDQARQRAEDRWNETLGRIEVQGGLPEDRVKFYTGLYHALLGRGLASDVDGSYPRNDGGIGRVALGPDGTPLHHHYNSDSLWGTFWNLNQLWAIAYPDYLSDYIRCHLDLYRDTGWLPDSIAAAKYVSGVGTDFTGVLICGAYQWGIRDYDLDQAFAAVLKNEVGWQNRPVGVGKADLKSFLDHGYVPLIRRVSAPGDSVAEGSRFSASHTLEYSYSSWAAAQFARALGRTNEVPRLLEQSRGWEKLHDAGSGFIRPRDTAGAFIPDFNPRKPWIGFQEGNAWQYTFYVPHDIPGLRQRMGAATFLERLEDVFSQAEKTGFGGGRQLDAFSGLENVYNHGNQPSLHIAWLFNPAGQPGRTQHWVRRICDEFYGTDRTHGYGYGQDEDQGQLGAWFVLAGLGLFDIQGGTSSRPEFQLATPLFERIRIRLHPLHHAGEAFEIRTVGDPRREPFIRSARLDGADWPACTLPWERFRKGGILELEVGTEPSAQWGRSR